MKPNMFQPALAGGVVLGILSTLPIVSMGNLCCCLWVIAGGVVAAYLLQAATPTPITTGDGAAVGLLAGLIGAGVQFILALILNPLLRPIQEAMMNWALEQIPNAPDVRSTWGGGGFGLAGSVLNFFVMLIVGAVFSTVGGIIGAAIFKKKLPPASPGDLS
jgi:hypothetical protein